MKYIVIPPHNDPTLRYEAPSGWQMYDLMQMFVERVTRSSVQALRERYRQERALLDPDSRNHLLLLLAGQQLLAEADHFHQWLRALGASMSGLSLPPSAVQLWLDDLELVEGSTESSEDVLRASQGDAPYMPEQERASVELANAEIVRLYIFSDKQLPSAIWLAHALTGHCAVEMAGPFVEQHAQALQRLPVLKSVRFLLSSARLRARLAQTFPHLPERLWWNPGETPLETWGGYISLQKLLEPEALLNTGIKVAVVTFTALGQTVLDESGRAFPLADLCRGAKRLADAQVPVVAEWVIGAPGIGEEQLARSVEVLSSPLFFAWLAGLRRFHWPRNQQRATWSGQPVVLKEIESRRDLARSQPFDAPGTIAPERLPLVIQDLTRVLTQHAPFSPGRVAGAYCVHPPEFANVVDDNQISLDVDCVLVNLPQEAQQPDKCFAVNLRLHTITALDHRLAARLTSLRHGTRPSIALSILPPGQREAVVSRLCQSGILMRRG